MTIKVYTQSSTLCANCTNLCRQLDTQGTEYELIKDTQELFRIAQEKNIMSVPIVETDGNLFTYEQALKLLVVKR
jgi:predicted thioredoxin/glutaredoxin